MRKFSRREIRSVDWRAIDCDLCYAIAGELCRVLDDNGRPTGSVKTAPHADRVSKAFVAASNGQN